MILIVLAYLGGVLTIVSPCILPVLPFVFARADRPFLSNGLPMLRRHGARRSRRWRRSPRVGGGWAVEANAIGRVAAIALLAVFGAALLFPAACRTIDAAAGAARRPPRAIGRTPVANARRVGDRRLAAARRRDRPALGALRRADPRPGPDRRGAARRERHDDAAAARLCARRRDLAGAGAAGRRPRVRGDEALARRRRMDPARARRRRARRRRRDRASASTPVFSRRLSSPSTACSSRASSTSICAEPRRQKLGRHERPGV